MGDPENKDDQAAPVSLTQFLAPLQALSLDVLPFEVEMVERSSTVNVGSMKLRLTTPEDLIIMKAIAHRPKDLGDIEAIAANHPGMDKERIRYWVEQLVKRWICLSYGKRLNDCWINNKPEIFCASTNFTSQTNPAAPGYSARPGCAPSSTGADGGNP